MGPGKEELPQITALQPGRQPACTGGREEGVSSRSLSSGTHLHRTTQARQGDSMVESGAVRASSSLQLTSRGGGLLDPFQPRPMSMKEQSH